MKYLRAAFLFTAVVFGSAAMASESDDVKGHSLESIDNYERVLHKQFSPLGADIYREDYVIKMMFRDRLFFNDDSRILREDAEATMTQLASVFRRSDGARLLISVHASPEGNEADAVDKTRKRAAALRSQLIVNGVSPRDVQAEGFGSQFEHCSNETEYGRLCNQRVEYTFVFK